jgi:trehalose 6-phosphate synthase
VTESPLVVVANRLPVSRVEVNGQTSWQTSPGGLVSALGAVLHRRRGMWVGWPGDDQPAPSPFEHDGILQVPVALSTEEIGSVYDGFANRTLWPLYHDAVRHPEFNRDWWQPYVDVNARFATVVAEHAPSGATVWMQDYHLQLAPALLRRLRPDVRIGFFLHIPFPPQELFAQLPWRRQILEGLLGADLFGCHTRVGAENFAALAKRYTDATDGDREGELRVDGRVMRHGAFPVSIDFEGIDRLAREDRIAARTAEIRQELGAGRRVILGVDRLDYTKGIDVRLRAYGQLLDQGRITVDQCVLIQTGSPTRSNVPDYVSLRRSVEEIVGSINGRHGRIGRMAVQYLYKNYDIEELVALFRAADVMLVTPLRDGMNLVCKEYVASRVDDTGVLVLSEFTGAAHELVEAILVNPHDLDALTEAILRGLKMSTDEQQLRMRALRRHVQDNDVYDWADSFLAALAT